MTYTIPNITATGRITRILPVVISCCLISACATQKRSYPKDYSNHTSQARPIQKPYTVAGKRYEPLSSHVGFVQEGIASSYGSDFHGRKTSSGELFDMNDMTAAHKTLPLGVYVKVNHKRTGREIIVRINDRGPFVSGRIIDLSERAARELDMLQEGVAEVKITALGYKGDGSGNDSHYRPPTSYDDGRFALQVAALRNRTNAYRYAAELKRKYGAAEVQEAFVDGNTFYRVRLGLYSSLQTAQSIMLTVFRTGS
ncbi:MAG: septal ring lytic transglycosylase RlpA family protein [Desulfuromonadaceae bacterium]|nr:septal ring lytic transglycosylase RlpA family protein [Desulfuromonadaceae bacterium]MDD2854829.1 septal ring lytic transglycosylase RlpA family protein [Desulfuromonadaceae bacterium]